METANAPIKIPIIALFNPKYDAVPAAAAAPIVHNGQCAYAVFSNKGNRAKESSFFFPILMYSQPLYPHKFRCGAVFVYCVNNKRPLF